MSPFHDWVLSPQVAFIAMTGVTIAASSIPAGIVGSWIVVNRISYLAAAVAHAVLGGVGIGIYLRHHMGWEWVTPFSGGLFAGVLSAWLVSEISHRFPSRSDIAISLIWTVSMAIGMIAMHLTPGYHDPAAYLFGNVLLVSRADLWITGGFGLVLSVLVRWAYPTLEMMAFDPEFAQLQGVRVRMLRTATLALVAIAVVVMLATSGILLVIALMTLPAATLLPHSRSLGSLMMGSCILTGIISLAGFALSWYVDFPTSATIVLLAAGCYLAGLGFKRRSTHG